MESDGKVELLGVVLSYRIRLLFVVRKSFFMISICVARFMSHGECGDTFLRRVVSCWGHSAECVWWPHLHSASRPWLWPDPNHTQQLPGIPLRHSRPHPGKLVLVVPVPNSSLFYFSLYFFQFFVLIIIIITTPSIYGTCADAECEEAPGAGGGGCWWGGLQDPG